MCYHFQDYHVDNMTHERANKYKIYTLIILQINFLQSDWLRDGIYEIYIP